MGFWWRNKDNIAPSAARWFLCVCARRSTNIEQPLCGEYVNVSERGLPPFVGNVQRTQMGELVLWLRLRLAITMRLWGGLVRVRIIIKVITRRVMTLLILCDDWFFC